jgi:alpha-2-macroglobulin
MKSAKTFLVLIMIVIASCGTNERKQKEAALADASQLMIPIDKGFSEYISGYTSGVIAVNSGIEIRFTPEFAARADKKKLSGLFVFDPSIKGKAEWTDDVTLIFRPSRLLDYGKLYDGKLNLYRLGEVNSRLRQFPLRVMTMKKDFSVLVNNLESAEEGESYNLNGELITSDFIDPAEVESYMEAKLDKESLQITWDHSSVENIHKFLVGKIAQTDSEQELILSWDGNNYGIKQKASTTIRIPKKNDFSIQNINLVNGESQRVDIVLSNPVDPNQEMTGLIWLSPSAEFATQINANIISIFPTVTLQGQYELNVESSLKSAKGITLSSARKEFLEFSTLMPAIKAVGKGVILPASGSLVFPFMTANLKSVDLKIIKIYENNLPYFLQLSDINEAGSIRRFGRPIYSGRIDLTNISSSNSGKWNLNTLDLSDYISVEPGVLYKVKLGMRKSYSLYNCTENTGVGKYEEMLVQSEQQINDSWDDADSYYDDYENSLFYRYGYDWRERSNPCREAYYSPDKNVTKNLLASNLGIMAKKGDGNQMMVFVNDIRTTDPVSDATVEIYNLQLQVTGTGSTAQDGTVSINCPAKPFLIIVKKGSDRNYLKTNDGSSLSLSSFDVQGIRPEKGIKTFIYGERDVWRPGDSIFLSVFIRDQKKELPVGHPIQFELMNPLDQKIDNQVQNLPATGLLVFRTKTPDNAITGNYNAIIRIGGAEFTKRIRIETVKPNRLKVELTFPNEILGGTGGKETGTMHVKWLNGAIAKNLNATVELLLRPVNTTFAKYPNYEFNDPASRFSHTSTKIFDGLIDDNGTARVDFEPSQGTNAPGMLNAIFTTRVFEKGGDASIIQNSYRFAPFEKYVGINFPGLSDKGRMLFTDASNEIKLVTVDKEGKPVSSDVEINIYKLSYRWWWEANEDDLGTYIASNTYRPVLTKKVSTPAGEGSMSFIIPKNDWGRYLVRATASSGHSAGKVILVDWPWEYGSKGATSGATVLSVNTDKEKYNPGDNIQLSFPAPANSRAIITLENATGIVEQTAVSVSGTNSVVNLKATAAMAPNVYAYVTLIQPHGQTTNDMPVRLYGIVPVLVEDASTRLKPRITMPDEVRSQQTFELNVSEINGKAMSYTIAVIDEGLLDITGFRTPDPWSYFYAREALGVKTWDIYDYVLGALGGTLDRALAVGGDEALKDKASARAKRFIPVVRFLGPFELGAGKINTHRITLPLYTGSVKTMVIGGSEKSFGYADKQVFVRDPLMILATAPRVLSPEEKVSLPVTVFVQKDNIRNVTVEVSGNEFITFKEKKKNVAVSEPGERDIEFEFTTAGQIGKAEINITATGGGEKATYKMEIEVRSPNPPETRSTMAILKPGEKYLRTFLPFGIEGTGSAMAEVSLLPSVNLNKRLGYLIEYPHGCSEQITSGVFPQLWLKELSGNDPIVAKSTAQNIMTAINMLSTRQIAGGGISLWPGSSEPDNWVTSYAGHFLIEAEKMGYSIPSGFRQKWLSYQRKTAQSWRYDAAYRYTVNDQAYRLFTLAIAGQPEKGAMNRLRETPNIPGLSKWLLAASFAVSGRKEVAEEIIDVRSFETEPEYYDYYYGGYLRDRAIILFTLTILNKTDQALPLLKAVCDDLNKDYWYSTQTISWGLFAYMKFAGLMPTNNNKTSKILLTINDERKEIGILPGAVVNETLKMKATNNLLIENTSQNPVYVTFIQKGIPLKSDLLREDKGLAMTIRYLDMAMKPVDERALEQGSDFAMVVSVTNTSYKRVENIALSQLVPAGWEIQNTRLFEADWGIKESPFDYRDYRDDRVYTYFSLGRNETKTFIVILNAAYKGKYYQPSVFCEAMYTENCYSRIPGKEVTVTGQ